MADALLSPAVGLTMAGVSAVSVGFAVKKIQKNELSPQKLPMMAVSGAFVFAAQMINFTIPATGSSGHIGGGVLLAALLGGYPALLVTAVVLLIQCLFFADGGLLALGCNIFNLGVLPCLVAYPLLFKPLTKKGLSPKSITLASIVTVVVGLQLGSLGVVMETVASGISALPFAAFAVVMQPIHLAIGLVEGIVTGAVLSYVYKQRPEILESVHTASPMKKNASIGKTVLVLALATAVTAGGLSLLASAYPDGLEWSMEKVSGSAELETAGSVQDKAAAVQESTAFLPDYDYKENTNVPVNGTTTAGLVGSLLTFGAAGLVGVSIAAVKKHKKHS